MPLKILIQFDQTFLLLFQATANANKNRVKISLAGSVYSVPPAKYSSPLRTVQDGRPSHGSPTQVEFISSAAGYFGFWSIYHVPEGDTVYREEPKGQAPEGHLQVLSTLQVLDPSAVARAPIMLHDGSLRLELE